jgi:hypothetical protein
MEMPCVANDRIVPTGGPRGRMCQFSLFFLDFSGTKTYNSARNDIK